MKPTPRKGTPVRHALREEPVTFVRLGIPGAPHSRKWATVRGPEGEYSAAVNDLYPDGPEWAEWLRVYAETSAEARAEVTCPCCGHLDYSRIDYNDPEHRARNADRLYRLGVAHDAAIHAAGRQTFTDQYGYSPYGKASDVERRRQEEVPA